MKCSLLVCVFCIVASGAYAAQLYRWVDKNGNVEWRDTPPPSSVPAKAIEQRRVGGNVIGTSELPYATQLAVKNHPVALWNADCGPPCTSARNHLNRRGIPHTEKTPQSDAEGFKKVSPASEVPILFVDRQQIKGYQEAAWDDTLDAAGYPRTAAALKPKPAAVPAAPPQTRHRSRESARG
ncbi:MAG: DUF4124 domain-containing protein [Betaproteobacteria bacterium]|nr:DUF4124 domain-containing protein [Betaproteobacteria bacterium]